MDAGDWGAPSPDQLNAAFEFEFHLSHAIEMIWHLKPLRAFRLGIVQSYQDGEYCR